MCTIWIGLKQCSLKQSGTKTPTNKSAWVRPLFPYGLPFIHKPTQIIRSVELQLYTAGLIILKLGYWGKFVLNI